MAANPFDHSDTSAFFDFLLYDTTTASASALPPAPAAPVTSPEIDYAVLNELLCETPTFFSQGDLTPPVLGHPLPTPIAAFEDPCVTPASLFSSATPLVFDCMTIPFTPASSPPCSSSLSLDALLTPVNPPAKLFPELNTLMDSPMNTPVTSPPSAFPLSIPAIPVDLNSDPHSVNVILPMDKLLALLDTATRNNNSNNNNLLACMSMPATPYSPPVAAPLPTFQVVSAPASPPTRHAKYTCTHDGCGKSFTRRFNLETHVKTHDLNRPRPFRCELCSQSFVRPHDLERHYSCHRKQKEFSCQHCTRQFTRSDALRRHLDKQTCQRTGATA
ncbi:uncharacterized protein BJ171DRAFT_581948 [Polychytrium aggregatum]|uniref:uncharacterized protein n=1 Tax=Polychytrium aggregatum TaxID=110093 RepID=UPI0022FE0CD6|nr:uncharacterized protein BJ171DRAFT_581948 [Polychytrium aggregatum]KAI9204367.1 hypothetical protein BJ171DRAFT_581948 [Polychytrium aggregatum]